MGAIRQTLISKDIISFKKTLNAYIYSIIKMNSNYYNGVSEITYPKIAGLSDMHIPADTRSAFPVISVQSPVSIQCCWQS